MKQIFKPIKRNEQNFNVTLLHKALAVFELTVSNDEVSIGKAGEDTLEKLRILQNQLYIRIDDSVLLDEATAVAITENMVSREIISTENSFNVSGKVFLENGSIKKNQQLIAFDLDLRGVAVFRTVKNLLDINEFGGFDYLGTAVSDKRGNYDITFYEWQYKLAERGKADVVVFAIDGANIIGHSRMVNTEDYSDKGRVSNIDIKLSLKDDRTEYQALMDPLNVFLKQSRSHLGLIADSDDQLAFTASELDIERAHLDIAALAQLIVKENSKFSHELLYGIGRQSINLNWTALYKQNEKVLRQAITRSVEDRIIKAFSTEDINRFIKLLQLSAINNILDDSTNDEGDKNTVNKMLSNALENKADRISFLHALNDFEGSNYNKFWDVHLPTKPEFIDKPELISGLILTQKLSVLVGNHQPLVTELQVAREIKSVNELVDLEKEQWLKIVETTGAPDYIEGEDESERKKRYVDELQSQINAAFPTLRIAKMVDQNKLAIEKISVKKSIGRFFKKGNFDIAKDKVHEFLDDIKDESSEEDFEDVKIEILKFQRLFQVSTKPEVMVALLKDNLHSAYTIASIPRKTFIRSYSKSLGGKETAFAVHQRASHINTRIESIVMELNQYSDNSAIPAKMMSKSELTEAQEIIKSQVPNFQNLFGSADLCECRHCRSVFSPAAYFVELLQFLNPRDPNPQEENSETALNKLELRRPDLFHLALSCENTHTNIPYIDLVNEVMEYYVAKNNSFDDFKGYDTGDTTEDELRANPQHYNLDAYIKLNDAVFPFSLPFHQPLDEIRTYSDFLKVSRYEVMKAINYQPADSVKKAMGAEYLGFSQEEYILLTKQAYDHPNNTPELIEPYEYFGYENEVDPNPAPDGTLNLEKLSKVREFMKRTGVAYIDLVELVKTRFINPDQDTLDFLQKIFSSSPKNAKIIYSWLKQAHSNIPDNTNDDIINAVLDKYNEDEENIEVTLEQLEEWAKNNFDQFKQVITLFEPASLCNIDTTRLRTIEKIYEDPDSIETTTEGIATAKLGNSGITSDNWVKWHRFIRLWKKLGWSIHETDLVLTALGETDIDSGTIEKLESVFLLKNASKQPLIQLAVLWGDIDTYGTKSLYKKLFLNKAIQQIDSSFKADAQGNYFTETTVLIKDHLPAILAAFRLSEEELDIIVIKAGINLDAAILNLSNLSSIYKYIVLAKILKLRVTAVCKLIGIFAPPATVFSSPEKTYDFYKLANSVKVMKFKPTTLDYIFNDEQPDDSKIGLNEKEVLLTGKTIHDSFIAIDLDHPFVPEVTLSKEIVAAKLAYSFQSEIINRFMEIVEGSAVFEVKLDENLEIEIPETLIEKYFYTKGSGMFRCIGNMSDDDKTVLKNANSTIANFSAAVNELYLMPESFISNHFSSVFDNTDVFREKLLDRSLPANPTDLEEKFEFVYEQFLPFLKQKLKKDAVSHYIANLIGLSEEATTLLSANNIDALINDLSINGFSATYYKNIDWSSSEIFPRVDSTIDFSWGDQSPPPKISENELSASVSWETYISVPASGNYTLLVDIEESDEALNLYLDNELILDKSSNNPGITFEKDINFNAAQLHFLKLEYAELTNNAGIRLRWKSATSAPEVIPATVAYPAKNFDDFVLTVNKYHRAALFISGFKISETELNHFLNFNTDFSNIDFNQLTPIHWQRIRDYSVLRNAVPQAQTMLTEVFSLANRPEPKPTLEQLRKKIRQATAWDETNLKFLVTHFQLKFDESDNDFKNEVALNKIYSVMTIVSKTGLSAETIAKWGEVETKFDKLSETAQLIKNAVKAKYGETDWLALAADLSDKIREKKKLSLIDYLLVQPEIQNAGIKDADGLYEFFLIDVQMGACMDTSRIVQGSAAIQLFVNRILLNLEKDISPDVIDRDRWDWMKNYRFWEANRKVFLFPQNWLEPDWRKDRSVFFKELESYFLQNDITSRTAEQGLRNYLTSLNEVANLDVCGMHEEKDDNGKLKFLHVFARTHNLPYKYFYRRWNKYGIWSTWEPVQVDIRSVEDGKNSGVHLVPVVWKSKLFLFWPEFTEKFAERNVDKTRSMEDKGGDPLSSLEPVKYWEIRLAWSEYVGDTWSSKVITTEFISTNVDVGHFLMTVSEEHRRSDLVNLEELLPSQFKIIPSVKNKTLRFEMSFGDFLFESAFILQDIHSPVGEIDNTQVLVHLDYGPTKYNYSFSKLVNNSLFEILGITYLKKIKQHKIIPENERLKLVRMPNYEIAFDNSFFYVSANHTYFVKPKTITRISSDINAIQDTNIIWELMKGKSNNDVKDKTNISPTARDVSIGNAFSGSAISKKVNTISEKKLEFHIFYHPFSSEYIASLNHGGVSGLMKRNLENSPDESAEQTIFEKFYDPAFEFGRVKKHTSFSTPPTPRTAYKENICFDIYGANSQYNWELFFHAPLYIATRLSKNGKYEEAMKWFHHIFDPTTDEVPEPGNEVSRYWKVLPFKTTPTESLEEFFRGLSSDVDPNNPGNDVINQWRDNPFDPHLVAKNRPSAYMQHVVIKYVENLITWADSLFRQFTRETVYEAIQLYIIANHVLGPRPEFIPKRGNIKAETYSSLKDKLDTFGNALVDLENIFPYSSEVNVSTISTGTNLLGVGSALYFCIPANEKLLEYWDTVTDRLFKIRHCQDIDGVERSLALFSPAIDPAALIQANSQGLSLGSILADLSSPPPIYRFVYLIQKANEFCGDVKALGSSLLSAIEKKDVEELSRLRASQETNILELVTAIRERQVLSAKVNKENLLKVRETAKFRLQHYKDLLGDDSNEPVDAPSLDSTLNVNSRLPVDTAIPVVETDVDMSLVDSDEGGVKLINREVEELTQAADASEWQNRANQMELLANLSYFIPDFIATTAPLGSGFQVEFGGKHIGPALSATAKAFSNTASKSTNDAQRSGRFSSLIRRTHDWNLQANLAIREIIQLDKQITSADIQIQVAEKELKNHQQQIDNAQETELFLKDKFTNQELYQWMKEQLFSVYKQSYNLAYDMAKKVEKAYQFEMGTERTSFIQYGYWDNSKQGLVSGEKLQLALRQLESSFLDNNRRELELSKNISLVQLNPLALIELRETGKCFVSLPEELFDLDFQGHYFRRIRAVSLSIPCVTGPYTNINCSLRLLKNIMRTNTLISENGYEHNNEAGLLLDDPRFRTNYTPVTLIATSSAQNDAGMFEFNFRDERYLPFEGSGVISDWTIELSTDEKLRQFDYSTISDVLFHLKYTARESAGTFKEAATQHVNEYFKGEDTEHSLQLLNLKQDFSTEWHQFLHPTNPENGNIFQLKMTANLFPILTQGKPLIINALWVFARFTDQEKYKVVLTQPSSPPETVTLSADTQYAGLHTGSIPEDPASLEIKLQPEEIVKWQLKMTSDNSPEVPVTNKVKDFILVLGYRWE